MPLVRWHDALFILGGFIRNRPADGPQPKHAGDCFRWLDRGPGHARSVRPSRALRQNIPRLRSLSRTQQASGHTHAGVAVAAVRKAHWTGASYLLGNFHKAAPNIWNLHGVHDHSGRLSACACRRYRAYPGPDDLAVRVCPGLSQPVRLLRLGNIALWRAVLVEVSVDGADASCIIQFWTGADQRIQQARSRNGE